MGRYFPMITVPLMMFIAFSFCCAEGANTKAAQAQEGTRTATDANNTRYLYDESILDREHHYSQKDLDAVRAAHIYFCHHSIGTNIIDGLLALGQNEPKYKIRRTYIGTGDFSTYRRLPALGDSQPGRNGDPASKVTGFYSNMTRGRAVIGNNVQIAFHKFCYVDITSATDVKNVFDSYVSNMEALEKRYVKTIFVYTTVPLGTGSRNDPARNAYNALVRDYCRSNNKPLFDIASIETTKGAGERCSFTNGGREYDMLCAEYSAGDPHLNSVGGRRVAKVMMLMFADLLK